MTNKGKNAQNSKSDYWKKVRKWTREQERALKHNATKTDDSTPLILKYF
ncbi:hypothetical protein [Chondrinema litorale]|nr:hypothetical protein [Chondrinema litorale]UZR93170.1 hypothetical protein OQ292_15020 [Chondrinema litorale]